MAKLPADYSLLRDLPALGRDLAFMRALRNLKVITPQGTVAFLTAPDARNVMLDLRALSGSGAAPAAIIPDPTGHAGEYLFTDGATASWQPLHAETVVWLNRLSSAGGTVTIDSIALADRLIRAIAAASYGSKIVYLLPFLGGNLLAACVPLRDTVGVGIAENNGFTDAHFSQALGLSGTGGSYLNSRLKANQLGTGSNGGLGYWEKNWTIGGVGPMGASSTNREHSYELALRDTFRGFRWGATGGTTTASESLVPVNGHYYGQRSASNSRRLYLDGAQIAASTASDGAVGIGDQFLYVMAANWTAELVPDISRCAVAYMTDGTLSADEIADFHTLLGDYLITPTGR